METKASRRAPAADPNKFAIATSTAPTELPVHPFALRFPLMSGEEYEAFKRDIAANKQKDPIIIHGGMILDGRHRYRACRELGITPHTDDWDGEGTPESYICSKNVHRRHLTDSQKAMIAASLASLGVGRPGKIARIQEVSQVDVARLLGVSRSSVQPASRVAAAGDAALGAMVMNHQLSVSTAAAIAMLPPVDHTDAGNAGWKDVSIR